MGSACSMEWGRWEVGSGVLGSGEGELIGELGVESIESEERGLHGVGSGGGGK